MWVCGELQAHMEHLQTLVCNENVEVEGILQPCIQTESSMMYTWWPLTTLSFLTRNLLGLACNNWGGVYHASH